MPVSNKIEFIILHVLKDKKGDKPFFLHFFLHYCHVHVVVEKRRVI